MTTLCLILVSANVALAAYWKATAGRRRERAMVRAATFEYEFAARTQQGK